MPEKELTQSETLSQITGNLTGLAKRTAAKIINSGFFEELKNIQNTYDVKAANDAVKKLLETTVQSALNDIRLKITMIPIIITGVFGILAIIITLVADGNILIPVIVSAILIVMIWFIAGKIFKLIARNISGILFNVIKSKLTQFNEAYHE